MALEEALFRIAFRTAHEADRPVDDIGQHGGGDRLVIAGEGELGEAELRGEYPVGGGERDAGKYRLTLLFRGQALGHRPRFQLRPFRDCPLWQLPAPTCPPP